MDLEQSHLTGDPDVLRLLADRRADRSLPGARRDPFQIALVVGGGGMRGAYVAGMLLALEEAGLRDAFDDVYGSSSGAASAAAFVVGSAGPGARCFPEDLASRRFIDMRRLALARRAVSLNYFFDEVLEHRKPMAWTSLMDSPTRLHVVATDAQDLSAHTLSPESPREWKQALRASATIPMLAGRPVPLHGRNWIDGSVAEPLSICRALTDGATHVVALLCRGPGELDQRPVDAVLPWRHRATDRIVRGLGTLAQGTRRYTAELTSAAKRCGQTADPAHVFSVGPSRSSGATSLGIEPRAVDEAVAIGRQTMASVLGLTVGSL